MLTYMTTIHYCSSAIKNVLETAVIIASKSPVAVQNTKKSLVYSQSRPNEVGLEHIVRVYDNYFNLKR